MAHNFQFGKNHTTNIDDANTFFLDGGCFNNLGGVDVVGGGTSSSPFKTFDFALSQMLHDQILVIADGTHDLTTTISKRITIIADTKKKVILNDPSGLLDFLEQHARLERVVIKNFNRLLANINYGFSLAHSFKDCFFLDVSELNFRYNTSTERCKFLNGTVTKPIGSDSHVNAEFYNVNIIGGGTVQNYSACFFDQNCRHTAGTANINISSYCAFEDKVSFENNDNTDLNYDGTELEDSITPFLINSEDYLDSAVAQGSPLRVNSVGSFFEGISFFPNTPGFVDLINSSPDIEIVNSEIVPISSVAPGETVYTIPIDFTASTRSRLTKYEVIGINTFCNYVFEVRTADVGENIENSVWKLYKEGELMTKNPDGTTTGELTYNWSVRNFVNYKFAQGRLGITKE